MSQKSAVVSWTGGKDSSLALFKAKLEGYQIKALVTFVPEKEKVFKAHPVIEMKLQAESIGLPHKCFKVREDFAKDDYIFHLEAMAKQYGVESIVTGDIDLVDGLPNWIEECCQNIDLNPVFPLWNRSREEIMDDLFSHKIGFFISLINDQRIPKEWLRKPFSKEMYQSLKELCLETGIDLCGENGEFHTMTYNAPFMKSHWLLS